MPQNKTSIEWTDLTVNPIRARDGKGHTGHYCEKISPGCANCYASGLQRRFRMPEFQAQRSRKDIEVFLDEKRLLDLLKIRKPQRIFPFDMTDLFGEWVPDEWIVKALALPVVAYWLTFQILTKRPERMLQMLMDDRIRDRICAQAGLYLTLLGESRQRGFAESEGAPSNVWLGVSCENQEMADERIPLLLRTPAAVRWVSAEPLLGPIDFEKICGNGRFENVGRVDSLSGFEIKYMGADGEGRAMWGHGFRGEKLDWIVVGGESGPKARPMHPDWARSIRDQCQAAGVAFFFKQWGQWLPEYDAGTLVSSVKTRARGGKRYFRFAGGPPMMAVGKKAAGRLLDGVEHSEFPEVRG